MKKLLLYSAAMSIAMCSFGQQRIVSAKKAIYERDMLLKNEMTTVPLKHNPAPPVTRNQQLNKSQTVNVVPLGSAGNAFTVIGIRSNMDYNPDLQTLTFVHRADPPAVGASTGDLVFDISTDNGTTWTSNLGPIYTVGAGTSLGRYPNACIYNPSGNTDPASAYLTYYAPCTDGAAWSSDIHGTAPLTTGTPSTQTINTHPMPDGTDLVVPDGMTITHNGQTYVHDVTLPDELTTSYTGVLQIRHGVWNGSNDFTYTTRFVNLPVSVDNAGGSDYASTNTVAFANDGLTGYALINGHLDYTANPDSAYFPIITKTTDGGVTWSAPFYLSLNGTGPNTIDALLNGAGQGYYMAWVEADAVVDMNGNLHCVMVIGPSGNYVGGGGYSILTDHGTFGVFDIYTSDGGTTWHAELLGLPQTFSGTWTSSANNDTEYHRCQASRTWSGDKVFFTWFDTDTVIFSTTDNLYPDMHSRALDVSTGMWTTHTNLTTGTNADGTCTYACVGPYAVPTASGHEIPVVYTTILTDISQPVSFNYIDGAEILSTAYTEAGNPANLTMTVGINEENVIASSTSLYPNPASDETYMAITLTQSADVTVELTNILGQVQSSTAMGKLNAGQNTLKIDLKNLKNGIYIVTVKAGDHSITKKLTVN